MSPKTTLPALLKICVLRMSSLRASFSTKQLRRAAKNWLLKQPGHEVVGLFLVKKMFNY